MTVAPDRALRLAEELRARYPAELVAAALTQQSLRIAGREKFSRADEMFFTRAGLEQASAEVVASHSARRFRGAFGSTAGRRVARLVPLGAIPGAPTVAPRGRATSAARARR